MAKNIQHAPASLVAFERRSDATGWSRHWLVCPPRAGPCTVLSCPVLYGTVLAGWLAGWLVGWLAVWTQPQPQSRPWCAQLEHTGTSRMVRRRSCIVSNALQAARALYKALQDPRSCLRSKKNRTLQYQPLHKVSGSTEDWAHGSSLWRLQADATSTATSCEEISKNDFCVIKSCASLPSFGKGSVRLRKDLARRVGH
jgi:hypothetical protein